MRPGSNRTTRGAGQGPSGFPSRLGLSIAFTGIAALCWLLPARAQEHKAPPAGEHAPAQSAPHAPAAPHGPDAEHAPSAPNAPHTPGSNVAPPETAERGSHQGPAEHGPGGQHGPQGSTHEVGKEEGAHEGEGHGGAEGHGKQGEHGEGGHGEGGHGEAGDKPKFDIHLPTWLYGPLKKLWYSGPATLSAEGIVDANNQPVEASALGNLKGKQIEYTYEDHHKEYHTRPVIGTIGSAPFTDGAKTETITVDGASYKLINPTVTFPLKGWLSEGIVISVLTALTIALLAIVLTRSLNRIPDRKQTFLEIIYGALDNFVHNLVGDHYKRYVPLVATAFIYILIMNLAGLIPGWMSPTANINVTAGMALVVVAYVQFEGIRANGFVGYVMHFVGEPWWLFWLNVPIHVIGELAKILSLTIRLFGNIFGEDVVIVILILLGVTFTKGLAPVQLPMYFLAIFTSFVQAMVFSILTCVYIALMTTHEDHGEHHGEHGHDDHGHMHDTASPAPAV